MTPWFAYSTSMVQIGFNIPGRTKEICLHSGYYVTIYKSISRILERELYILREYV